MYRTSNPVLNDKIFSSVGTASTADGVMTINGTINKSAVSLMITTAVAVWAYSNEQLAGLFLPALIVGFITAMIITFKQTTAPYLTPLYAALEGVVLGYLSLYAASYVGDTGIIFQAVGLTCATLFALLGAYRTGMIKVTQKFRAIVLTATGGIFLFYMVSIIARLFGANLDLLYGAGALSIGISLFVVAIAALNLVLQFDFIDQATASQRMPKYMEWYAAFGLLVTIVWLYIEIIHLLMKLQSRD